MKNRETVPVDPPKIDFVPLWDYILVEPVKQDGNKIGSLVIPDGSRLEDTKKGLVVKAGKGAYRESGAFIENPIREGDYVYFMARSAPFAVVLAGKHYLAMAGRDVIAIAERPVLRFDERVLPLDTPPDVGVPSTVYVRITDTRTKQYADFPLGDKEAQGTWKDQQEAAE